MASRRGPRRTRVYDANYSIGESYYKSALDDLDRKYSAKPVLAELSRPRVDFGSDLIEDDLSTARQRAHRAITEETVFDSRGGRMLKSGTPLQSLVNDEFSDDIQSTLNRFRATKSAAKALDDVDYGNSIAHLKIKARADMDDSTDHSSFIKRRVLKAVQSNDSAIDTTSSLAKWTKVTDMHDAESFAAQKAKDTKARIHDIEEDMYDRSERQAARDRRTANVRKFISDSAADDSFSSNMSSMKITSKSDKKIVSF